MFHPTVRWSQTGKMHLNKSTLSLLIKMHGIKLMARRTRHSPEQQQRRHRNELLLFRLKPTEAEKRSPVCRCLCSAEDAASFVLRSRCFFWFGATKAEEHWDLSAAHSAQEGRGRKYEYIAPSSSLIFICTESARSHSFPPWV